MAVVSGRPESSDRSLFITAGGGPKEGGMSCSRGEASGMATCPITARDRDAARLTLLEGMVASTWAMLPCDLALPP